jgi:hypothetical protein
VDVALKLRTDDSDLDFAVRHRRSILARVALLCANAAAHGHRCVRFRLRLAVRVGFAPAPVVDSAYVIENASCWVCRCFGV